MSGTPALRLTGTPALSHNPEIVAKRYIPKPQITPQRVYTPNAGIYLSAMKQRAIKMPDELWDAVQNEAAKVGLTAGEFVRLAVEEKLDLPEPQIVSEKHHWPAGEVEAITAALNETREARIVTGRGIIQATTAVPAPGTGFKCRVPGCEFQAGSSKAFCPNHPGPLLPV